MVNNVRHKITHALHLGEEWIFRNPKYVLSMVMIVTLMFGAAVQKPVSYTHLTLPTIYSV